jgi:hypothetical protein
LRLCRDSSQEKVTADAIAGGSFAFGRILIIVALPGVAAWTLLR